MPVTVDDLDLILAAAAFAADKHRKQRRKDADASPYINHPLALAHILSREGGISDRVVLCAALLHDTVEDTETTVAELERLQVASAASKSSGAKLVKLADKISNLRDIAATPPAGWSAERRAEYYRWSKEVVAGLRGVSPALERAFDEAYATGLAQIGD